MAKFSQPAFSQSNPNRKTNSTHTSRNEVPTTTTAKKNRNERDDSSSSSTAVLSQQQQQQQQRHRTGSRIMDLHQQRVQTAGRVGTKRFVNPCLVFVGNLPYSTTSDELQTWLCQQMATPAAVLLHQKVDIIRDWKTGQSKGYAFVTFAAAHYATLAIDQLHQREYDQGRLLTVAQGKKKPDPNLILLREQKQQQKQTLHPEEQQAEQTALEILEPEEYALLARLDPDLLVHTQVAVEESLDDDDGYDGYDDGDDFVVEDSQEDTEIRNRQQRRDAAKSKKRTKVPHKGFGWSSSTLAVVSILLI